MNVNWEEKYWAPFGEGLTVQAVDLKERPPYPRLIAVPNLAILSHTVWASTWAENLSILGGPAPPIRRLLKNGLPI